jgi:hypothetical protein
MLVWCCGWLLALKISENWLFLHNGLNRGLDLPDPAI